MRTLRDLMAIAASLGILAGCGGASNTTLSYSAFSTAANSICKNTEAAAKAVGHASSLSGEVPVFTKYATELQDAAAKLKALSGPAALESARDKVVSALDQLQTSLQNLISDARSDNQVAFQAAQARFQAPAGAQAAASELGAPACSNG